MVFFSLLACVREVPAQSKTEQVDEQRLRTARELVSKAVTEAATRLDQKKCSKFFGETAKTALQTTDFRVVSYGAPVLREGKLTVPMAQTMPNHKMVVINLDGPFFNQRALAGGSVKSFGGIQPGTRSVTLSDSEFRVLLLLHELGHVIGKFDPDSKRVDDSRWHTDTVVEHCF
jgi:hypothetical protein